jgi:hypothetical protein
MTLNIIVLRVLCGLAVDTKASFKEIEKLLEGGDCYAAEVLKSFTEAESLRMEWGYKDGRRTLECVVFVYSRDITWELRRDSHLITSVTMPRDVLQVMWKTVRSVQEENFFSAVGEEVRWALELKRRGKEVPSSATPRLDRSPFDPQLDWSPFDPQPTEPDHPQSFSSHAEEDSEELAESKEPKEDEPVRDREPFCGICNMPYPLCSC